MFESGDTPRKVLTVNRDSLFESNGAGDPSLEDWDPLAKVDMKAKLETGMDWWVQTLATFGDA